MLRAGHLVLWKWKWSYLKWLRVLGIDYKMDKMCVQEIRLLWAASPEEFSVSVQSWEWHKPGVPAFHNENTWSFLLQALISGRTGCTLGPQHYSLWKGCLLALEPIWVAPNLRHKESERWDPGTHLLHFYKCSSDTVVYRRGFCFIVFWFAFKCRLLSKLWE